MGSEMCIRDRVITTDLYTETPFVKKEMPSDVNGINVTRHKAYTVSGEAHYVLAPGMVKSFLSKEADVIHTHSYGYFQNHAGWIRERFQSNRPTSWKNLMKTTKFAEN